MGDYVEHALVSHPKTAEAAVVGFPHEVKGAGLFCYVILKDGVGDGDCRLRVQKRISRYVWDLASQALLV